ncbi:hypothetical protein V8C86DRAFT_2560561 [Haematococcus lacustris]
MPELLLLLLLLFLLLPLPLLLPFLQLWTPFQTKQAAPRLLLLKDFSCFLHCHEMDALGCDPQQQGPGLCLPAPGLQLHQPRAGRHQLEDGRPEGQLLAGCPVLPCLRCRSHQPGPGPAVLLGQLLG